MGHEGNIVSVYNKAIGPTNHAEQVAISEFYRQAKTSSARKIKMMAVAGARAGEEVIRCDAPYCENATLDDVECSIWLCGKCLEFIHDCTFNVPDVAILLVTVTGQVLKTSLRSLFPKPHTSFTVPYAALRGQFYQVPSTEEYKENANGNGS